MRDSLSAKYLVMHGRIWSVSTVAEVTVKIAKVNLFNPLEDQY